MKRYLFFIKLSLGALGMAALLSGCGEKLIELPPDQESVVIAYAAGEVAKANKLQTKGMTYEKPADAATETTEKPAAGSGTHAESNPPTQEAATPPAPTPPPATEAENKPAAGDASLTDALGLAGVTAEYQGYEVNGSYEESGGGYLSPVNGDQYVILKVRLSNTTGAVADANLFTKHPVFLLGINGQDVTTAKSTILLSDLSTYMDSLEPGESVDTVLIFEVKSADAASISTLSLKLKINGATVDIAL